MCSRDQPASMYSSSARRNGVSVRLFSIQSFLLQKGNVAQDYTRSRVVKSPCFEQLLRLLPVEHRHGRFQKFRHRAFLRLPVAGADVVADVAAPDEPARPYLLDFPLGQLALFLGDVGAAAGQLDAAIRLQRPLRTGSLTASAVETVGWREGYIRLSARSVTTSPIKT